MITFDNWRLASDGAVLAMQYDNKSRLLEVLGDLPQDWTWTMLVAVGQALDVISMDVVPGGLEAVLTAETLSLSGYYSMQLKGVRGDVVRHTNVIRVPVQNSLSGDAQWPTIPTEFTQLSEQVQANAEAAAQSAQAAAASAQSASASESAAAQSAQQAQRSAQAAAEAVETVNSAATTAVQAVQDAQGTAETAIGEAQTAAVKSVGSLVQQAEDAAVRQPILSDHDTWMIWDAASGQYVDTGLYAGGQTPYIGENGHWYVGDTDTGVSAQGPAGPAGTGVPSTDGVPEDYVLTPAGWKEATGVEILEIGNMNDPTTDDVISLSLDGFDAQELYILLFSRLNNQANDAPNATAQMSVALNGSEDVARVQTYVRSDTYLYKTIIHLLKLGGNVVTWAATNDYPTQTNISEPWVSYNPQPIDGNIKSILLRAPSELFFKAGSKIAAYIVR